MKGQFPWIGRSRGSAGGMTTAKINDKNVMRAKAYEVTNPKTAAQVMQRDFFKQVQEVCASVTEDQLRSLFGVKPKTMTRRNALSKQIAAAYSVAGSTKSVDFSKLQAIGNGQKVNTPIFKVENGSFDTADFELQMFGQNATLNTNLILVQFDTDNNKIIVYNTNRAINLIIEDDINTIFGDDIITNGYFYPTCAENGENVYQREFGSFTIKTRATD